MSTSASPPEKLRAQAHNIAVNLKKLAGGGQVADDPLGKIAAARARGYLDFAIVMDDKIIKIEVPFSKIDELTLPLLCDFIYDAMRGGTNSKEAH